MYTSIIIGQPAISQENRLSLNSELSETELDRFQQAFDKLNAPTLVGDHSDFGLFLKVALMPSVILSRE